MSNQTGFLLSRQCYDTSHGIVIALWLKTVSGPVKLLIENERALFFVETSQQAMAQSFLNNESISISEVKALPLKAFNQQAVSCFYFKYLRDFYRARELLKQCNIKCYEDDFRPDDRFLMERFITASIQYQGHSTTHYQPQIIQTYDANLTRTVQNIQPSYKKIDLAQTKPIDFDEVKDCELSVLSIDIECAFNGELYSIGAYSKDINKVFMIGDKYTVFNGVNTIVTEDNNIEKQLDSAFDYIEWVSNEKALLCAFIHWFNINDPDIIIGWNVINFDFSLLQKRCDLHNIPFAIGRDGKAPYWRKNPMSEQKFIAINGRVVLDGIDLLKTATYNFASFSLEFVSNTLLGLSKKVSDVDNRLDEINHNFKHDKTTLAAYNLEDCRLVWLIFEKTDLLNFAQLRAQLTGLDIDRVGGSVAAFTNLYTPKLHRAGYIAPNMGDGDQDFVSPGGYVMDSIPGLYDDVLVLDFKSLYPSIIRTFNIDPMGLVEGLLEQGADTSNNHTINHNSNIDKASKTKSVEEIELNPTSASPIKGYDGAYFSREKHFLPHIIESLWAERDKAKASNNAALSQAIKIIMNSFYGVLGSTGCRFFDPRLSGSITKRSHDLLKTTRHWIEENKGYSVIYGDTDSIFVDIGKQDSAQNSQQIGKELQNYINDKWQSLLLNDFHIKSQLEIEFETHFTRFLMPTIRGLEVGTKKRYAGLVEENNEQHIVFKGLESVRTDWTELSKNFQRELYHRVFNNLPVKDYVLTTVEKTHAGVLDEQLIYRKRIRRKLNDYIKNVPPHIKAARLADEINEQQGKPLRYQNKGWIEYVLTLSGPQAKEHVNATIDYQLYVDRQLKAVADAILPFIGTSFDEITDNQLSLF